MGDDKIMENRIRAALCKMFNIPDYLFLTLNNNYGKENHWLNFKVESADRKIYFCFSCSLNELAEMTRHNFYIIDYRAGRDARLVSSCSVNRMGKITKATVEFFKPQVKDVVEYCLLCLRRNESEKKISTSDKKSNNSPSGKPEQKNSTGSRGAGSDRWRVPVSSVSGPSNDPRQNRNKGKKRRKS